MTEPTEHGYAMLLLGKLLEAQEIPINPYGDWFLNGNSLPAIRCMWFRSESNKSGQLDVQVAVKDGVIINESVAGVGILVCARLTKIILEFLKMRFQKLLTP